MEVTKEIVVPDKVAVTKEIVVPDKVAVIKEIVVPDKVVVIKEIVVPGKVAVIREIVDQVNKLDLEIVLVEVVREIVPVVRAGVRCRLLLRK